MEARTARSGTLLGVFDMRYAYMLQPFELVLDRHMAERAAEEGIVLRRVSGASAPWILLGGPPPALRPHVLRHSPSSPQAKCRERLRGLESVQPFGWMEGCVLDALHDLSETRALEAHLRLFLPDGESLVYENPVSRPADNRILNIEETLPFAVIAKRLPSHRSIGLADAFWRASQDADGCVITGGLTSAEGSYTVAWPMAAVARSRRDPELENAALQQLRVRQNRLTTEDGLFLRRNAKGQLTYRNWARGVAWYGLGLARTLRELRGRDDTGDLREELRRLVTWTLRYQRPDGLWNCFLHEPETRAETSGSAGIAAMIVIAAGLGLAPNPAVSAARRTAAGLETFLTPDGFLTGVAQSNRGGEQLQRSGYRVISQMAMGLYGQLSAALSAPVR